MDDSVSPVSVKGFFSGSSNGSDGSPQQRVLENPCAFKVAAWLAMVRGFQLLYVA